LSSQIFEISDGRGISDTTYEDDRYHALTAVTTDLPFNKRRVITALSLHIPDRHTSNIGHGGNPGPKDKGDYPESYSNAWVSLSGISLL
jgi:hypothetical protein